MPNNPKQSIVDRVKALQDRRAQIVAKRVEELARIDDQITSCQQLLQRWDSVDLDSVLALLKQTGIGIVFEA